MNIRKLQIGLLSVSILISLAACEDLNKGTVYDENSSIHYAINNDTNPNAKVITYSVADQLEQDEDSPFELYYSGLAYSGDVIITVIEKETRNSIELYFGDRVIKTSKKGRFGFEEEYRVLEIGVDNEEKVNLKRIN